MRDYKYEIQMRAEEMAEAEFGSDFYDLPQATQNEVYTRAMRGHFESVLDRADYLRKAERENGK